MQNRLDITLDMIAYPPTSETTTYHYPLPTSECENPIAQKQRVFQTHCFYSSTKKKV